MSGILDMMNHQNSQFQYWLYFNDDRRQQPSTGSGRFILAKKTTANVQDFWSFIWH